MSRPGRSAGSAPADSVDPAAVEAMREVGIDMSAETPKILTVDAVKASDVCITRVEARPEVLVDLDPAGPATGGTALDHLQRCRGVSGTDALAQTQFGLAAHGMPPSLPLRAVSMVMESTVPPESTVVNRNGHQARHHGQP
ncbi:hypothetical protein [Streptomyces sp. NPDC051211]|uniref:hypothetical protein n=1 Tax=Streptomyces sp. NPDC051211 TaxID=3154643 RepID=UPI00344CEBAE